MKILTSIPDITLAVNVGSSSIKTTLFNGNQRININLNFIGLRNQILKTTYQNTPDYPSETISVSVGDDLTLAAATISKQIELVASKLDWPAPITIGHRVKFAGYGPIVERVTPKTEQILTFYDYLSSRHNKLCLAVIRETSDRFPDAHQFIVRDQAVDDLTLHDSASIPFEHAIIRRYGLYANGYHGLATKACLKALSINYGVQEFTGLITQIGSGVSVTAVKSGRVTLNTMKFSACDGPTMHNRSGTQPVGIILRMLKYGLPSNELADLHNRRSGIYGLASLPSDSTITVEEILTENGYAEAKKHYLSNLAAEIFKSTLLAEEPLHFVFSGGLATRHTWLAPTLLCMARQIDPTARDRFMELISAGGRHVRVGTVQLTLIEIDEQSVIREQLEAFTETGQYIDLHDAICEAPGTAIGRVETGLKSFRKGIISLHENYSKFDFSGKLMPEAFVFTGPQRGAFLIRASFARTNQIPAIFLPCNNVTSKFLKKTIYLDTPTRTAYIHD